MCTCYWCQKLSLNSAGASLGGSIQGRLCHSGATRLELDCPIWKAPLNAADKCVFPPLRNEGSNRWTLPGPTYPRIHCPSVMNLVCMHHRVQLRRLNELGMLIIEGLYKPDSLWFSLHGLNGPRRRRSSWAMWTTSSEGCSPWIETQPKWSPAALHCSFTLPLWCRTKICL